MDKVELENRTKKFAIDVIKFTDDLRSNRSLNVLVNQSIYWIELMKESGLINSPITAVLKKEANELTAIYTAIGKTAKENQKP